MNTTRLVSGKIFFDEFDNVDLDPRWTLVPNNPLRYSLVERPGYLKIYHGDQDIMFLIDEPDQYFLDMKNDYVPLNELLKSGIVVFKELEGNLEILEYYDETRDVSWVYEYIRLIKNGNVYTVYAKNTDVTEWELIASLEFESAGKLGLVCKGPNLPGSSPFSIDFFRLYKSNEIQIINVPLNYRVNLHNATTGVVIFSRRVVSPYNGATLILDEIPNYLAYFTIVDENSNFVHQSQAFQMCGGDVYFYGSTLRVFVNGNDMKYDTEYFLGYFQSNEIDFVITLQNDHEVEFNDVLLEAIPFEDDLVGYSLVTFSSTLNGTYTDTLLVGSVPGNGSTEIYGKIVRSDLVEPSDVNPFKFNLKITNS